MKNFMDETVKAIKEEPGGVFDYADFHKRLSEPACWQALREKMAQGIAAALMREARGSLDLARSVGSLPPERIQAFSILLHNVLLFVVARLDKIDVPTLDELRAYDGQAAAQMAEGCGNPECESCGKAREMVRGGDDDAS